MGFFVFATFLAKFASAIVECVIPEIIHPPPLPSNSVVDHGRHKQGHVSERGALRGSFHRVRAMSSLSCLPF